MNVFEMSEGEFKKALAEKTTPDMVYINAPNIYNFLSLLFEENCSDSTMREWAFQWWSEQTGESYDKIYDKWLEG